MNNYIVDMGEIYASTKENRILGKPFRTNGSPSYGVYVKDAVGSIKQVSFDACKADENSESPLSSSYWGSRLDIAKAATAKPQTLDYLCNFFTEKVKEPDQYKNWDNYSFYSKEDLLKALPELKNVAPTYTLQILKNKGSSTPSDTLYNSKTAVDLEKQQSAH
jgi:hypothetical protein